MISPFPVYSRTTLIHAYGPGEDTRGGPMYHQLYLVVRDYFIVSVSETEPEGKFDAVLETDDAVYPSLMNLHNHTDMK